MLTKRDITHPRGQKFGVGEMVRIINSAPDQGYPDFQVGDLCRVVGSYAQKHRAGAHHGADYKVYEIIHVEREVTFAWVNEECLELVPEKENFNPFKWVRAKIR